MDCDVKDLTPHQTNRPKRILKFVALLEGLRRLMLYKLALHVLVTFTEQVVPIHKHIAIVYSEFPQCAVQKLFHAIFVPPLLNYT